MVVRLNSNIFFLCSLFLVQLIPYHQVSALSFNLTNITRTDHINLIRLYGNSNLTSQGIELITNINQSNTSTDQLKYQAGRAVYFESLHLHDSASGNQSDFTTHFSFLIESVGTEGFADGFAFFLIPNDSLGSDLATGAAFGLPVDIPPYNQRRPTVAVEFDTYYNPQWDPPNLSMSRTHVGIDVNSLNSSASKEWLSDIPNGVENEAWVSYNPSTKVFKVIFTNYYANNNTKVEGEFNFSVDLKKILPDYVAIGFSASTGNLVEKHYVKSWDFNSSFMNWPESPTPPTQTTPPGIPDGGPTSSPGPPGHKTNIGLVVGLTVGSFVLVSGLVLVCFVIWRKQKSKAKDDKEEVDDDEFNFETSMQNELETAGRGPKKYSFDELSRATNNFSEEEKLGEGGFGGVYRGFLRNLSTYIAVKRVSEVSKQGLREFASEVKIISQLRHRNLVKLIGWCHEKRELLLVYEFMQNGSLDHHIFKQDSSLSWAMRYKIAQGLASALLYLHEECEQLVVHRDIKSSNVMLDSNFNAKLGDFGLAKLIDHEKGAQTTAVAGTRGYMAPEYIDSGRASKESDMYSFGIVALEIACGRKPIDLALPEHQIKLIEWVWNLYGAGKMIEAVDPKLSMDFDQQQMECLMIVGLWCAHPDCNLRPSIRQAFNVLNFEAPLPVLQTTMPVATYSNRPDPELGTSTTSSTTIATSSTTTSSAYSIGGAIVSENSAASIGGGIVSENSLILSAPR